MSKALIDVHMIVRGAFARNACTQAAKLEQSGFARVHRAPFVPGNVLHARANGYAMGSAPFVAHVDDDDEILDVAWLEQAAEILHAHPDVAAVYPRYRITDMALAEVTYETPVHRWTPDHSRRRHVPYVHNFTVMRRSNVAAFFKEAIVHIPRLMVMTECLLFESQPRHGRLVSHDSLAYNWKIRSGSAMSLGKVDFTHMQGAWFKRQEAMNKDALRRHQDTSGETKPCAGDEELFRSWA